VPPDRARLARPPGPGLGRRISVELERTLAAPMPRVWALLRDYRVARPRLLTGHFTDDAIRERGERTGTVIEYRPRIARHERRHVVAVHEPLPGRVLRERARGSALVSTGMLTPGGEGEGRSCASPSRCASRRSTDGRRGCGRSERCTASAANC
jgi:hypothetical protein